MLFPKTWAQWFKQRWLKNSEVTPLNIWKGTSSPDHTQSLWDRGWSRYWRYRREGVGSGRSAVQVYSLGWKTGQVYHHYQQSPVMFTKKRVMTHTLRNAAVDVYEFYRREEIQDKQVNVELCGVSSSDASPFSGWHHGFIPSFPAWGTEGNLNSWRSFVSLNALSKSRVRVRFFRISLLCQGCCTVNFRGQWI